MPRNYVRIVGRPTLAISSLVFAAASVLAGDPVPPGYGGGYYIHSEPLPASYYGYNLDDPHPGYYGGSRYREYYSFGRGYGIADFPPPYLGPVPYGNWGRAHRAMPPVAPPGAEFDPALGVPLPDDAAIHFTVQVPVDAELWIDGAKTRQAGATRTFVSPPLTPGKTYSYELHARWTQDGRAIDQTRQVTVNAGDHRLVDLRAPAVVETLPPPRPYPLEQAREKNRKN